jgi:hypothetical protein
MVWKTVRDFGSVKTWVPGIASLALTGEGVGAERRIVQTDGNTVQERLEAIDELTRTIRYAIIATTLPLRSYVATLTVRSLGADKCEVIWSAYFQATREEADVTKMLQAGYRRNLATLATVCRQSA